MNSQSLGLIPTNNLKEIISRLNFLRGLFAILIVMGHCSEQFGKELLPFFLMHKFNMVSVCFFFYISGLSLTYNFYHKQDYLNHFLRNKVVFLFILALIAELVGNLFWTVSMGVPFLWNMTMLTGFNWYIYEMIVFYVSFYLLYSMISVPYYREILMAVITLGICLITIYLDCYGVWPGWTKVWYSSSFSFLFGIIMGEHFDWIKGKFSKHGLIYSIGLFLVGLGCCLSLRLPESNLIGVMLKNLTGICVMALITVIVGFISPQSVPVIRRIISFLTKRSTEIYLYQFCFLDIVAELYARNGMEIDISYILVVVVSVCMFASIMYYIDRWVGNLVKK